ncbi:MAG: hypothetical protein WC584_01335 [Candidatus Pacearchaeota archaeon]
MLPKRFCEVMEKYQERKIIDSQDKYILEILVRWGLCNIYDSQVKLTYKGKYQLQWYNSEKKKTLLNKIFDFFR